MHLHAKALLGLTLPLMLACSDEAPTQNNIAGHSTSQGAPSTTDGNGSASTTSAGSITATSVNSTSGNTTVAGQTSSPASSTGLASTTGDAVTSSTTGAGFTTGANLTTGGLVTGAGGASSTDGTTTTMGMATSMGTSSSTTGEGTSTTGGSPVTCPTTPLSPGDSDESVQVGGSSRDYVLHVPQAYDGSEPVPLIVDFHPLGGSGPSERSGSPYPSQTDPEGVIMAFPSGLSGPSGGAWNVGPCCVSGTDDVEFARALVAQVQEKACIDPKRIYAVGFSMGGGMSHYVACHASDIFAAIAPAAFDLLEENIDGCNPSRPITVVSFRGTDDFLVPYDGGYSAVVAGMPITFLGANTTFETWASKNDCQGSASAENGQGCKSYGDCAGGTEVVLCTKQGGGHEAGNASIGWPILKQHTLP